MSPRNPSGGAKEPDNGVAVLVVGLLGLFLMPCVFGPVAWVWGARDLGAMRRGRMDARGRGLTQAGMLCGVVSVVLSFVAVCVFAAAVVLPAAFAAVAVPKVYRETGRVTGDIDALLQPPPTTKPARPARP